ncbi:PHP domain-containing protein [Epidermidibacterium keratini]|uniref:PHP domain-containing protein n=1 Tax=Epidermidibacterium keratini TaxID=1891644 RepID=A0A7L4YPC1_9ACTN|nr:PHP domain-containing protein [Epidermidibacterium keratini]QHC00407.1 PHP domain-containing protein [Epidermidibacterium keratini]
MDSPLAPLSAPVSAEDALRRTAFLLERRMESSYRIEAFRKALDVVQALKPNELEYRIQLGTLQKIDGIGKTTASLITEAVQGKLPSYLAKLQDEAEPLAEGGAEIRAALRGDLHMHSNWSDGGSSIEAMAQTAIDLGHEYAVLTDHSPRLQVANGLSAERLTEQLEIIELMNSMFEDFRLLKGIEVDILDDGALDQTPEMLDRLDVVVASVHSKLRMPSREMTARMLEAVRTPRVNVLGHCTGRLIRGGRGKRPPSEFDAEAVFGACAENDVAVEINSRLEREDPPDDLIALALDAGCLFSIDSDAHAPGQLEFKAYGAARAERLGVPPERIVNTWPVDDLLSWANV